MQTNVIANLLLVPGRAGYIGSVSVWLFLFEQQSVNVVQIVIRKCQKLRPKNREVDGARLKSKKHSI